MSYITVRELLSISDFQDRVLVESLFKETTRSGRFVLRLLQVALTPHVMIIAPMETLKKYCLNETHHLDDDKLLKLLSFYPLESLKLIIFKKSKRQSLKALFNDNTTRYFQLDAVDKRKIFWNLWCIHVMELSEGIKIWPFTNSNIKHKKYMQFREKILTALLQQNERKQINWIDKCLYLGSKRELEDNNRPIPVPGLGPTENIQLMYLKPQYFGCWDQTEHWVQCD